MAVCAALYNPFRPEGEEPIDPMEFYPYERSGLNTKPAGPTAAERAALAEIFSGKRD